MRDVELLAVTVKQLPQPGRAGMRLRIGIARKFSKPKHRQSKFLRIRMPIRAVIFRSGGASDTYGLLLQILNDIQYIEQLAFGIP
jgi:hypothetical protein